MIGMTKELINIKGGEYQITALMNASMEGHGKIVELLLNNGADVDVRSDFLGFHAIHYATYYGHLDVAKLIAKKHPEVLNSRTRGLLSKNETPLYLAKQKGHKHIVDWIKNEKGVME